MKRILISILLISIVCSNYAAYHYYKFWNGDFIDFENMTTQEFIDANGNVSVTYYGEYLKARWEIGSTVNYTFDSNQPTGPSISANDVENALSDTISEYNNSALTNYTWGLDVLTCNNNDEGIEIDIVYEPETMPSGNNHTPACANTEHNLGATEEDLKLTFPTPKSLILSNDIDFDSR